MWRIRALHSSRVKKHPIIIHITILLPRILCVEAYCCTTLLDEVDITSAVIAMK